MVVTMTGRTAAVTVIVGPKQAGRQRLPVLARYTTRIVRLLERMVLHPFAVASRAMGGTSIGTMMGLDANDADAAFTVGFYARSQLILYF